MADVGPDRHVRLPRLRAALGLRPRPGARREQLNGASSWAAIVACFGIGGGAGNVVALRLPLRRPVFTAALALVGASTRR